MRRFLSRLNARRSMGWLLCRTDDRLLRDIGLTRFDLEQMLDQGKDSRIGPTADRGSTGAPPCVACSAPSS